MKKLIEVEIWSDFTCPFCYIGKRKFENALKNFENKNEVNITWKSYQLNPNLYSDKYKSVNEYLAQNKQIPLEEAEKINNYVKTLAEKVDLKYDFSNMKVSNSLKAHQLAQLAKKFDKQNEIEELIFKAQFVDGKDIENIDDLIEIAQNAGISKDEVLETFANNLYLNNIAKDIQESQNIGVTGVPFFVFNQKYAISGAQDSELFLESLEKVLRDSKIQRSKENN